LSNREFKPADILKRKKELVQSKALTVIRTYDTFENESGKKDVSLCENSSGEKFILRIGETRPAQFFPEGYLGEFLIIPKLIAQDNIGIPFELEEFLEGILASEINSEIAGEGKIEPKLQEKLLSAFWEFQTIGKEVNLEQSFSMHKQSPEDESSSTGYKNRTRFIDKFVPLRVGENSFSPGHNISHTMEAIKGRLVIINNKLSGKNAKLLKNYAEIEKVIYQYQDFWNKGYPSKWKFSLDNIIITENGKVGLIDNAKIGLRYFGYDLGWLIWPLWVTMKTESYRKINEQLKYLDDFSHKIAETAPKDYSVMDFNKYFWLMILERIIGMYFDVVSNTKHLERWAIGPRGNRGRTEKYLFFLETLLNHALTKIK